MRASQENAQAFWEAFAASRETADEAAMTSLALCSCSSLYDLYRSRAERLAIAALLPMPSSTWRVLDLGCGPGRWTLPFAQTCGEVVAIDFSAVMLAHAQKRCEAAGVAQKVKFRQQRLEELDATALGGAFDLILAMGVLQFVPSESLEPVVGRIAACIGKGGRLLHRETRSPTLREKIYSDPTQEITMRAFYKPFAQYRSSFERQGLRLLNRRSIIPPSLLYSIYNRFLPADCSTPLKGIPLQCIVGLHEAVIDPLWRLAPRLLWLVNSRRPTDQVAALYSKD
ncbi:MAG: class I SAM-dependent methyltransferase [Planctomycetota bacterium]